MLFQSPFFEGEKASTSSSRAEVAGAISVLRLVEEAERGWSNLIQDLWEKIRHFSPLAACCLLMLNSPLPKLAEMARRASRLAQIETGEFGISGQGETI